MAQDQCLEDATEPCLHHLQIHPSASLQTRVRRSSRGAEGGSWRGRGSREGGIAVGAPLLPCIFIGNPVQQLRYNVVQTRKQ